MYIVIRVFSFLEVEENAALKTAQLVLRYSTAYPFTLEARKFIKCILCNETFDDPLAFRNHMDLQHEEVDKSDLVNINTEKSVTRVDITYLHCKLCKTPIESLEMFANHLANIHDLPTVDKVRWLVPVRLETNRYVCVLCDKKYTGWSQLFQHSGTHFSRYMCSGCGKNFETRHGLLQHLRNHHSHEFDIFCIRCKQIFPSKQSLKRHTVSEEYCFPYCCNICKQRFLFWERRQEHLVEVHCIAKKSYPCSECDRVFEKRTLYYNHFKAAHTGDFKCSYCDKQYASNKQLKLHIKHKHIDMH